MFTSEWSQLRFAVGGFQHSGLAYYRGHLFLLLIRTCSCGCSGMIHCCGDCGAGVVLLNTDGKTSFSDCLWAIATFTVYINSTINPPEKY